jgi:hypothetical protein
VHFSAFARDRTRARGQTRDETLRAFGIFGEQKPQIGCGRVRGGNLKQHKNEKGRAVWLALEYVNNKVLSVIRMGKAFVDERMRAPRQWKIEARCDVVDESERTHEVP